MKRISDIVLSLLGIILLSPFIVLFSLLIKLGSRGPVFYRGLRAGRDFKPFRMLKFRTMVVNAEMLGGPSTRAGDPRVTPIGAFLRRYKLDEIPQLFNVLAGDMSLVGPRPEVMEYANLYTEEEKIVYAVRPGITDYASLWNIDEAEALKDAKTPEETEALYLKKIRPEKVRLQMQYVKEQSFGTDMKILFRTLAKLFA